MTSTQIDQGDNELDPTAFMEAEGDDGDDGEHVVIEEAPPPRRRGRKPRAQADAEAAAQILAQPLTPPPPPMPSPTMAERQQAADQLSVFTSGLDFGDNRFAVNVLRVQPEYDDNGKRIAGYLQEFKQPISLENLRQWYGGGQYRVMVRGPLPGDPRKTGIISNKTYDIVGEPLPVKNAQLEQQRAAQQQTNAQAKVENTNLALVQEALGTQAKIVERVYEENRQLKDVILTKLNTPQESPLKDIIPLLVQGPDKLRQEMQEERRAQMEMMRLDREAQREQARLEREERQREREDERRRYEQERDERQRKHEKEMEILRAEMKASREDQKSAGKEQALLMQKLDAEKERQAQESQKFMLNMVQENAKQMATQLQQLDGMKTQFFLDAMKRKEDDFGVIDKLVKMKEAFGVLTGTEEKPGWERVVEKFSEAAPGIMAVVGQMTKAPPAPAAGGVTPGSVAAVDLPPARPRPKRLGPKRPGTAGASSAPGAGLSGGLAAAAKPPEPPPPPPPPPAFPSNPMQTFVVPASGTDLEEAVKLLVSNIDLAMQRDYSAERIYTELVSKFPPEVLALLKQADAKMCVQVISQQAPETWIIASPKGQQVVEKLHEMLLAAK